MLKKASVKKSASKPEATDTASTTSAESKVTVSKQYTESGIVVSDETSSDTIEVHKFVTSPASVSINLGVTKNIGDYNSVKLGVIVSVPAYKEEIDDAEAAASALANKYLKQQIEAITENLGDDNTAVDDPAEAEEAEGISEDDIRAMSRDELIEVIKENGLDVSYRTIKKDKALQDAIIDAMSAEGEEPEAEAEAEAEVEGADGDADSGDITADDVREMSRDDMIALINDNELDIDPKKYKKPAALAEKIIEVAGIEEAADSTSDGADDDATGDAGGDDVGISANDVREMDRDDLIALIKDNELDVNPKVYKKDEALAEAIIEAAGLEEADADAESEGEVDGGEDGTDEDFTEDDLKAMSERDLKQLMKDNDMTWPSAKTAAGAKALAIRQILKAQRG